jgi:hypothetical protein
MSPLNIVIKKNMKRNRLREAGASPARSRHCKGDCPCSNATVQSSWMGRRRGKKNLSQETCLFSVRRTALREIGRWFFV